ncbi:hypothetical protein FJZ26_06220 [Candidatus Parvarchaeota archaeon]|nr:hypothetical protein [Candidatus Parvarchaeota archaeon]
MFIAQDMFFPLRPTASQVKLCKEKSRLMMQRSAAYSNLIQEFFPEYIRLSIHSHSNEKISINLIPGVENKTPWHNALVIKKNGSYDLMKRLDAELSGYQLTERSGNKFFVEA